MTDLAPTRDREWETWRGVWVTDPPGQVVALTPKVGHVWVCDDAGNFHDVATADLVVAEQGTLL